MNLISSRDKESISVDRDYRAMEHRTEMCHLTRVHIVKTLVTCCHPRCDCHEWAPPSTTATTNRLSLIPLNPVLKPFSMLTPRRSPTRSIGLTRLTRRANFVVFRISRGTARISDKKKKHLYDRVEFNCHDHCHQTRKKIWEIFVSRFS